MKFIFLLFSLLLLSTEAFAMHISEGFLPLNWALFWFAVSLPFILFGFWYISKKLKDTEGKMLFVFATAFILLLSSLKIPSIMGSSSHPTGIGFGVILFGPYFMNVSALIVLFMQAMLVAHGGLTTLGANVFSMGIIAPLVTYFIYTLIKKTKISSRINIFLAAFLSNLLTYVSAAFQLALAFPAKAGVFISFLEYLTIFLFTQVFIAVIEGFLTVFAFDLLIKYKGAYILSINRSYKPSTSFSLAKSLVLIVFAISLMFLPLLFVEGEFSSTDDLAKELVLLKSSDYTPWFESIFNIPSSAEPFIFFAMGLVGFIFIAYYLRRKGANKK